MNWQYIVVGLIILTAFSYVGRMFAQKMKKFSAKEGCASDCGCDSTKQDKKFAQIAPK